MMDELTMEGSLYMRCTLAAWYTSSSRGVSNTSPTSSRLHRAGAQPFPR